MLGLLLLSLQATSPSTAPPDPCEIDRSAMLALGIDAFDQDLRGGWRALSERPGCGTRAADLIRDYREFYQSRMGTLYWHEGQLRAGAGQNEQAIALMAQSRRPTAESGWNGYVDATIAFLRRDREALIRARDALIALPRPAGFREETLPNGYRTRWPPNVDIVEGFIRCFDRPYFEAMALACRPPPQ